MIARSVIIAFSAFLLVTSCYEPIEGCLESEAENFDFSADDPCNDCCNFPEINISVNHVFAKAAFSTGTIYTNNLGDSVQLFDVQFGISQISLLKDEAWISSADSIIFTCDEGSGAEDMLLSNTHIGLSPTINSFKVNDFKSNGIYTHFSFIIGYEPCIGSIDTSGISEEALIRNLIPALYDRDLPGFLSMAIKYGIEPSYLDTLTLEIPADQLSLALLFSANISNDKGSNVFLDLEIDYKEILNDVQLKEGTINDIQTQIISNLPNAFSLN